MTASNHHHTSGLRWLAVSLLSLAAAVAVAMEPADSLNAAMLNADSLAAVPPDSVAVPAKRPGFFKRIIDYFVETEEEELAARNKRFSFSVLGGPSFSTDAKFGIGLAAVANYRLKGGEYPLKPSTNMIFANITTAKFWSVGLRGTTFVNGGRIRLNNDFTVSYAPRDFWGIGYYNGDIDDHYIKLHEYDIRVLLECLFRLHENLYLGPAVRWDYVNAGDVDSRDYFDGQDLVTRNYGAGFVMEYDSRDVMNNAYRGWYVYLSQLFRPSWLGNHYDFATTDLRLCHYRQAWRGAVIAGELRGTFHFGNPSWGMMNMLGSHYSMRGYYSGRYRDKYMVTGQVELRQRIYKSIGMVAWGGAGTVFHDRDSFRHWLPNYGVGLRWEFRNRVNLRLDYGFGKPGQSGFMFSINEAF